ncbi:sulfatase-like hydrolase/transferase [soil metagenome]
MKNLIFLFLTIIALTSHGQDQPNILWITVEDMSSRINSYGDSTIHTPNLNRLAREGVQYTNAYGTYAVCSPNRHTIITGMYPSTTGAMAMRTMKRTAALDKIKDPDLLNIPVYEATPPAGVKCFSEYLRAAGYYCTNNYKTDYQFMAPITAWDESSKEAHWRNRPDKSQPFFAVFNNEVTHESGIFERRSPRVTDLNKIVVPPYYPDIPEVREGMARHYDNIFAMDQWVGELIAQLEEDALLENTIIFFYSDHGDGLVRGKRWVYDSGLNLPLIIRFPDGKGAGTVNEELISLVDFAPTILSITNLEIPDYMQGQVFLGNAKDKPRKYIFAFRDRNDPSPETVRAVRDDRFKYIRNYRPDLPYMGFIPYSDEAEMMQAIQKLIKENKLGPDQWQLWAKKKPLEELYDTKNDPYEIQNLAANPAYFEKMEELRVAHESFTKAYGDLGMIAETELIKLLWPPNGKQPITEAPTIEVKNKKVYITSNTEGASTAYRFGNDKKWELYSRPFKVNNNEEIEAVSVRIGWKESDRIRKNLDKNNP